MPTISCLTMYILKAHSIEHYLIYYTYVRTVLYEGVTHPVNTEGALNPVKNEQQRVFYKKRENASRCLPVKKSSILQILCVFIWKKKRGHLGIHLSEYTVKKGQRFSLPQLGCHLPKSPWPGIINLFRPGRVW